MSSTVPLSNRSAVPGDKAGAAVATFVCPSDDFPEGNPHQFNATEHYGVTTYRANGGNRPFFATSSTNDGMFMTTGSSARKASSAPAGIKVRVSLVRDGLSKMILFDEGSHYDPNFNTCTAAGFNSGSTISTWSRWYPAGGDNGLGNILCGAFAPINYTTPSSMVGLVHRVPEAPGSSSRISDSARSAACTRAERTWSWATGACGSSRSPFRRPRAPCLAPALTAK